MKLLLGFVIIISLLGQIAQAETLEFDSKIKWSEFDKKIREQQERDTITGWSYIISGGLATVGGLVGYNNSSDPFSKGVYAISQSVGIAAVGYGGYYLSVGNEHNSFHAALAQSKSLTEEQKNEILRNYLGNREAELKKSRKIKAITHGLIAALNIYNGYKEQSSDLKTALYFVGGVNLLAAISFTF